MYFLGQPRAPSRAFPFVGERLCLSLLQGTASESRGEGPLRKATMLAAALRKECPLFSCTQHPGQGSGTTSHKCWTVQSIRPASPETLAQSQAVDRMSIPLPYSLRVGGERSLQVGQPTPPWMNQEVEVPPGPSWDLNLHSEVTRPFSLQTVVVGLPGQLSSPDLCGVSAQGQAFQKAWETHRDRTDELLWGTGTGRGSRL